MKLQKPLPSTLPNRVLINHHGEAWNAERAHRAGIPIDVIFLREDGWALGAPKHLAQHAYQCWPDEWTHYARPTDQIWTPIKEYRR